MEKKTSPLEAALATQIRIDLAARNWSQADLAERIGTTRETINKYMKGKSTVTIPVLGSMAKAFGYSPKEFMELVETRISPEDRWF